MVSSPARPLSTSNRYRLNCSILRWRSCLFLTQTSPYRPRYAIRPGAKWSGAPEQILADVADVVFRIGITRRFDQMVVGPKRCGPRRLHELRRRPHYGPSAADDVVLEKPRPGHAQSHHSSLQPSLQAVFLLRFHVEPKQNARAKINMNVVERRDSLATQRGPTISQVSSNTSLRSLWLDPNCGSGRNKLR